MDTPDISVVIPTRKGADLLPMSLAHLEVQTHPAARFEVLVVEHGGGTGAMTLLERYAAGAPVRTRCLRAAAGHGAEARNLGAREAHGRWLLFLDEELLAGPGLVAAHLAAQERLGGQAVVLGRVQMHPQVKERTFIKRYRLPTDDTAGPVPVAAWDFSNLSLPRSMYLEHGGIGEGLGFDGLQEVLLAWRLARAGIVCRQARDASAYAWRPARLSEERRRQYLNGYSLCKIRSEPADELEGLFPVRRSAAQMWADRLAQPIYRRLCEPLAEDSRAFICMCPRILDYDFFCGYRDALLERSPRFREEPPGQGTEAAALDAQPGG